MTRRQMTFIIVINALISLVIVLLVAWVIETRRPDLEQLAAIYTPMPQAILAPMATPALITPVTQPATAPQTPTAQSAAVTEADGEVYVVQAGDSLLTIATRFGVTVDAIAEANNLINPDFVFSGQRLLVPRSTAAANSSQPAAGGTPTADSMTLVIQNGNDLAQEAVVIINDSDLAFNLEGWRLEREGGPAYVFGNLPMFPGGSVRVHTGSGTNTSIDLYWSQQAALWQSGVQGRLINAQGVQLESFTAP